MWKVAWKSVTSHPMRLVATALSIVLGFSWLETTTAVIDLIDVPGHENFIRAMISGATGIDGILLCVAANEGVSRQTVEHFNVAKVLGVSRGVIVVTKADLVEPEDLTIVLAYFS